MVLPTAVQTSVENRMFSYITMNWRGRPLTSLRTMIELISATATTTGLTIEGAHDPKPLPKRRQDQRCAARCSPPPLAMNGMASGITQLSLTPNQTWHEA
jgi:hypothetical protein